MHFTAIEPGMHKCTHHAYPDVLNPSNFTRSTMVFGLDGANLNAQAPCGLPKHVVSQKTHARGK